ncbi:ABC bile acid transporter [Grosmannia clavigera kw1407]|uniref:ABC bile acid transporter n=1 Tax=Grosmannia clavigera (strain kw1407 / UAMH 11150) TaxID=655863 RepID=F0XCG3_GROCL|nr:ABC bile acid transporter [Grosmannia clavigera kw1407]EFX03767.1 ABC bile acid transporter [Grosmannia clavigera kw1407]
MGQPSCSWPIWRVDDFTVCFQRDYLKTLFPAIIISISFLIVLSQTLLRAVKLKRTTNYRALRTDLDHTALPQADSIDSEDDTVAAVASRSADDADADDDDDDDGLSINTGRNTLVRTITKGSIVQADTPVGQTLSIVVEDLAIAGLVAVNAIALATGAYGGSRYGAPEKGKGSIAAVVGLLLWVYAFVLVTLRLVLVKTQWRISHLWNHTAIIYFLQWLMDSVICRSVIIHPTSRTVEVLVIVEFALTSLLFFMAITTRKGNKTVLLEWEDGVPPSRESLASLFSHYTFSWVDSIVWDGYREPLEMSRVWNLDPKDKAAAVLSHYRRMQKRASLAAHLLFFFKGSLAVQAGWAIISGIFTFAPTMLLKAILEYVEDSKGAPINVLWLYVFLLPITDLVRAVGDNRALWVGRKICINIRAILVGEIYAKALRRKAATGKDSVLGGSETKDATHAKDKSWIASIRGKLGLSAKKKGAADSANGASKKAGSSADASAQDEQANIGTIINLMSVDSFKVSEVTAYLHYLVASAPTQLLVSVYLLYRVMGLSAIPGFIVMAALLPINIAFAKAFTTTQKKIMAATDKRIQTTNEVLQNIRIVKYFAWELRFGKIVDEKRRIELRALRKRYTIWACAVAIWNTVPILITFFCFLVYTVIEKKPLYPSVAFTAISLFMLLRYPLDQLGDMIAHVQESRVSIDRIEEFLSEEETEKFIQLGEENIDESTGERVIGFRNNASFIWGGRDVVASDGTTAFRLMDLNVDFAIGKLNVITGPTGSGKTSLLMALLGEMTLTHGRVYLPGGRSREDIRPDPETGLAESCAYVAQQAWLVNGTIRENILFSSAFDEQRYRDVIVACALEHDIDETLDNGDETLVGEKGITLSGGQKQRISLARALYSNSRHLLLDDCLSAVDSHTAKWIFSNCIRGPLMRGRTCILVTHNVSLCVPHSEYSVIMNNGRIADHGPTQGLIDAGKYGDEVQQKSLPGSATISRIPSRVPSSVGDEAENETNGTLVDDGGAADPSLPSTTTNRTKRAKQAATRQDSTEETKSTGAVKWSVMKLYLSSMGSWWFWLVAVLVFSTQQFSLVASNLWIKQWANQYTEESADAAATIWNSTVSVATGLGRQPSIYARSMVQHVMSPDTSSYLSTVSQTWMPKNSTVFQADSALAAAMDPQVNVQYYLLILAIIGIAGSVLAFVRDIWIFFGSLTASWKLHDQLMHYVAFSKFKFFDVTPLGQMMNRFSKDLEAVDQEVAPVAITVMTCALGIVITIVLIAMITPGFLVAALFITVLYVLLGKFYLASSRDLKRLESVQRSPLFQQFGETLSGVTTIRAYGDERRFVRDNLARINAQLRPFIYLWAANRWLSLRTDLLGNMVSFFAGVFVILSLGLIDAGSAGISLSYAIGFAENILWLVRLYAMNEQNMNSVERIKEYLEVEQEAPAVVEDCRPPANWPSQGAVEFVDYTTRYREDLDPVLRHLTFRIAPHEKVGIVGRTGAGKSSLALALFRALEAETGKVLIDGLDIGQMGLRDLREAITIVPQEPTLFMGTIRSNLDPFDNYSDEDIFAALRRVHLIGPDERIPGEPLGEATAAAEGSSSSSEADVPTPTSPTNKNVFLDLSTSVAESGSNLSQGQRQLLCLARAMLKNPNVLLMDEATASIDYATDAKIQDTIRELTSTIITIAHRLQTIADYDKVLVLDRGSLVEYDHPWKLMSKEDGVFRSMCDMSGDYETLAKIAKKAFETKTLIDVEQQ